MKRRLAGGLGAIAIALLALGAPVSAGSVSTHRIVDDDGKAGLTDDGGPSCSDGFDSTSAPGVVFSSISAAVAAAGAGDTIFICPGTYNESVTVSTRLTISGPYAGASDIKCKSRTGQATLIGAGGLPALSLAANGITVDGMRVANTSGNGIWTSPSFSGYTIINNVIANNSVGVDLYSNGALPTTVMHNCFQDNNNGGPGYGVRSTTDSLGAAAISENAFWGHRVGAIVLGGSGVTADISVARNWSWDDKSFLWASGVSRVEVRQNHVLDTDDISTPSSAIAVAGTSDTVSVDLNSIDTNHVDGVLVSDTANHVWVRGNKITGVTNGLDITTSTTGAVRAKNNVITDVQGTLSASSAGIRLDVLTVGNRITHNKVLGIADTHCQDLSVGGGTAGTANFWISDKGQTSSPSGICTP